MKKITFVNTDRGGALQSHQSLLRKVRVHLLPYRYGTRNNWSGRV